MEPDRRFHSRHFRQFLTHQPLKMEFHHQLLTTPQKPSWYHMSITCNSLSLATPILISTLQHESASFHSPEKPHETRRRRLRHVSCVGCQKSRLAAQNVRANMPLLPGSISRVNASVVVLSYSLFTFFDKGQTTNGKEWMAHLL